MENCATIGSVALKLSSASGSQREICQTGRITSKFSQIIEVRFSRLYENSIHVHPNRNQKIIVLTYLKLTELHS